MTTSPTSSDLPDVARVREAWDAVADGFDRHTTPHTLDFGEEVVSRLALGPGVRVLDVAAGSGGLAIPAARAGAEVVAVDIAPGMVDRLSARARAEGLSQLVAEVGDGTALSFEDDSFDQVVSMNGISVFDDLAGGLGEAVRVTRPGGHVAVVAFGPLPQVQFVSFFLAAVRAVAPEALPPSSAGPPPPFRLSEPAVFAATLESAGLTEVVVDTVDRTMAFASVDDLLDAVMSSNPIARQLTSGFDEDRRGQLRQTLDGMLREHSGGRVGADLHARLHVGRGTVRG